jgi:hypothetical protein
MEYVEGMIVPEPHIRPDAADRGYTGIMPEREVETSKVISFRLSNRMMEQLYAILGDERFPYGRNPANFFRHATYELLYVCYMLMLGERGAPETIQFMESQRMLKKNAFIAAQVLDMAANFHSDEVFLVHAVERGTTMEIHRHLEDIATLYADSPSETWRLEYQGLIARSAAVQAAINHVVHTWTGHKDSWKREQAARWESWWAAVSED